MTENQRAMTKLPTSGIWMTFCLSYLFRLPTHSMGYAPPIDSLLTQVLGGDEGMSYEQGLKGAWMPGFARNGIKQDRAELQLP